MKLAILSGLFGAACALASPVTVERDSRVTIKRDNDGLEWISQDDTLPKVLIFVAGGTILSASNYSRLDNVNYGSGQSPTIYDLIGNYSEVLDKAQLAVIPYATPGGSSGLNSTLYFNISRDANKYLCAENSDIAGGIMTHGTNTEEDTAFGVDLTFNCSKPFIATGAMRPETYLSHDGPSNLYQAIAVASDPKARDRGAMFVFNDRIVSAFYGQKTNANSPDTFLAPEQGNLGVCLGGQPYWYFSPSWPTAKYTYDLSNMTSGDDLPAVVVLFGSQGFDATLMYAAVANGAKGIVIQGAGAGQLSPSAQAAAAELKEQGIPVVASLRPWEGASPPTPYIRSFISSGAMGAGKSRIQLQLCLATGMGWEGCRQVFEHDMREAIYNDSTDYYYQS